MRLLVFSAVRFCDLFSLSLSLHIFQFNNSPRGTKSKTKPKPNWTKKYKHKHIHRSEAPNAIEENETARQTAKQIEGALTLKMYIFLFMSYFIVISCSWNISTLFLSRMNFKCMSAAWFLNIPNRWYVAAPILRKFPTTAASVSSLSLTHPLCVSVSASVHLLVNIFITCACSFQNVIYNIFTFDQFQFIAGSFHIPPRFPLSSYLNHFEKKKCRMPFLNLESRFIISIHP